MEILLKISDFKGGVSSKNPESEVNQKKSPKGGVSSKNPEPQKPQKIPAKGETVRGTSSVLDDSFRIKVGLEQLSKQQPQKPVELKGTQEQIVGHDVFNHGEVKACIKAYIAQQQPDTTIVLALETHQPTIEREKITLWVDNQLQIEKLETIKAHLSSFLMKYLNNGAIVLNFQLFDTRKTTEKKKLYTAAEKFDYFVELNPVIAELKQLFGLELK